MRQISNEINKKHDRKLTIIHINWIKRDNYLFCFSSSFRQSFLNTWNAQVVELFWAFCHDIANISAFHSSCHWRSSSHWKTSWRWCTSVGRQAWMSSILVNLHCWSTVFVSIPWCNSPLTCNWVKSFWMIQE